MADFRWYTPILDMTNVIFDFDGTIADSLEAMIEVFYEIKHQEERFTDQEIAEFRGLSLLDMARRLNIAWWRTPYLTIRGRKLLANHIDDIKLFVGIDKVIKTLHKDGYKLYIMSSNSKSNIQIFLKKHDLESYFVNVYGGVGLFSKARALRVIMLRNRMTSSQCFYVGDEGRDIKASGSVNVRCIAVTWGLSNVQVLESLNPYALVTKPQEIVATITNQL